MNTNVDNVQPMWVEHLPVVEVPQTQVTEAPMEDKEPKKDSSND